MYFAILLRNHLNAAPPRKIALPDTGTGQQVRERIPFSVPLDLWREADAIATRAGGTVSLLVEALATADLQSPGAGLTIQVKNGKPKIR